MVKTPTVSVVVPFYENLEWLDEALASVNNQNFTDYEVIIVNDGSLEDTSDLEAKYSSKFLFFYKNNGGPASARNFGINKARGKYVAFLDSDDYWEKNKLEEQVKYMEENNLVWSQHSYDLVNEVGNFNKKIDTTKHFGDVYKQLFISFKVQTSTVMVLRNKIIENNIYFPEDKRYGQDVYFYLQLAKRYPLGAISIPLSSFRNRGKNAGFNSRIQIKHKAELIPFVEEYDFSKRVKLAYSMCVFSNNLLSKFDNKINKKFMSKISNIFYVVPYTLLHSDKEKGAQL